MTLLTGIIVFAAGYLLGLITMAVTMSGQESRREEARGVE